MKVILQEIPEESGNVYKVFAEVSPSSVKGYTDVTFSTLWTGAKKPNEPHIKYRVHLTDEGLKKLKELL